MEIFFTSEQTYLALLVTQAFHLMHHRWARREISYVEGFTALVLCIQPHWVPWSAFLASLHVLLIATQIVGSIFIDKLSPQQKPR